MIGRGRPVRGTALWPADVRAGLAELLGRGQDWHARSACRRVGWAVFDPTRDGERGGKRGYPARAVTAARVCATCPVQAQCEAFAREYRTVGVWAGMWFSGHGRHHHGRRIELPGTDAAA